MYALNLVFDPDDKTGRFVPYYDKAPPMDQSLSWLDLKPNEKEPDKDPKTGKPLNFDPEKPNIWLQLGAAGTLLIPKRQQPSNPNKHDPDWICIRVVQQGALAVSAVRLVVSFGRPVRAHQPQASPFAKVYPGDDPDVGRAVTTFVEDDLSAGPVWWFPLKQIAIRPGHPKLTHRYEFSVGLIVNPKALLGEDAAELHYGEDPEMDIEM